jgi:dynein light intermediate chain 2
MASKPKKVDKKEENFEDSIFAKLVEEQRKLSVEEEFTNDVAVLFCGSKKSGKTSLIDRFINPNKEEKDVPKPTVALDYKFARYASDTSTSKVLAHLYDLGGDDNFEEFVKIPMSPEACGNLVLGITVDISEPHSVIPALEKWLRLLRVQVGNSLQALAKESQNGAKRVQEQQARIMATWEEHPDKASVLPFPVPLVIFATKCDVFLSTVDPEKCKGLCRALRYFAHAHGASLVFSSIKDKPSMNNVRALLRQLLFGVTAKQGIPEQLDPSKPLCIVSGKDNLHAIGAPQGRNSGEDAWRDLAAQLFPDASASAHKGGKRSESDQVSEELPKFAESSIDGMVEQRIEELQQYRRQVERNLRLASEGLDTNKMGVY